ncbi:hypothetical protein VOLCADRAFT_105434 [Volvox carteri f. nagariensis]|uniref:Uncharacterized protein n=1 Tax=Volvox carteri f. nagariensis TaxID=3068 RepID=D8U0S3_VOLCA|nr:uncharacterized protein VOLCADRAFT_105434 [Volvox carteri f. nagariensis]EFJ46689.1 hypothetical protein VOLCADRAFT_105434 [Volvox carteri f. nagariensis]|eukprot:XP_002952218.1 hypothetical protein VOLCADRAFT_105434 [Volvox carteri f. nagariensis]
MGRVYDQLEAVDVSGDKFHEPLPLGPDGLRYGNLPNGMKYYVRQCAKPKGRCALALAVRVGSVVEEEDERGVAHIVEHLAFNATESYSNHDIVRLLERIGAEFGACQNAYTSADETVYTLTVPTGDKEGLLDETLGVMAEMAFKIRCDPGDLAKERGAVLEEWRMSRDAGGRLQEAHWQLIFQGSKYADRLPIGTEAVIRRGSAATVRAFYERWYRPENMALVAVGDFAEPDVVVDLIRRHLGSGASRSSETPIPPPRFEYVPHAEPRFKVLIDRETQHPVVYVSYKHPRIRISTPGDFLEHLTLSIFEVAINNRLYKISRQRQPPFASASVSEEPLCATTGSCVLSATAMDGEALTALESLLTEVARVRLHGIGPAEFARAISEMTSEIENTALEADQGYCTEIRDEYVRHFLYNEFVTGMGAKIRPPRQLCLLKAAIGTLAMDERYGLDPVYTWQDVVRNGCTMLCQEYESRLGKTLIPLVTREAVEQCAKKYRPCDSCVVKASVRVVDHSRSCTEDQLRKVLERVAADEASGAIGPWEEPPAPESLMTELPTPLPLESAVVQERHFPAPLDVTELTLCNGMRVAFKSTTFMRDEIHLTGFAVGGLSETPLELFYTSSLSGTLAGHLGVFGFRPDVLGDILAGRRVELETTEGEYDEYDSTACGSAPSSTSVANSSVPCLEVETAVKLVRQAIEAQLRNPLHSYHQRVRYINYGGCYYFKQLTLEEVDKVDPALALAHHNLSWRNPAEFTLVLTGNVDRGQLEQLLCRYLATLPKTALPPPKLPKDVKPLPYRFPETPVVEDVKLHSFVVAMVSPVAQSQITFPVSLSRPRAREEVVWLALACRALETRLIQRMRFVSVSSFFGCVAPSLDGDPEGDVAIMFSCDPANKDRLVGMALEEVAAIQASGMTTEEVETLINLERLQYEESLAENSYWHEVIVSGFQSKSYQLLGGDLGAVYGKNTEAREKVWGSCTPETLQEAFRRLFPSPPTGRYTAISMLPRPPGLWHRIGAYLASKWLGASCGGFPPPAGGMPQEPPPSAAAATTMPLLGSSAATSAGGDGDGSSILSYIPAAGITAAAAAAAAVGAGLLLWSRSGQRRG